MTDHIKSLQILQFKNIVPVHNKFYKIYLKESSLHCSSLFSLVILMINHTDRQILRNYEKRMSWLSSEPELKALELTTKLAQSFAYRKQYHWKSSSVFINSFQPLLFHLKTSWTQRCSFFRGYKREDFFCIFTHFWPIFQFYNPGESRKPLVFCCS